MADGQRLLPVRGIAGSGAIFRAAPLRGKRCYADQACPTAHHRRRQTLLSSRLPEAVGTVPGGRGLPAAACQTRNNQATCLRVCPTHALTADVLYRPCRPESVPFETTASAARTEEFIGQQAAIEAVQFGVAVQRDGYNLFVVGPGGVGKQSIVLQLLSQRALEERPTEDWCYVHNFPEPHRPRALALPPGRASAFRDDLERTVAELQTAVRAALEGEEYRTRRQRLERELSDRQERALRTIERQAREWGASISREEDGFTVSALRDGQSLPPREFEQLPEEEQAALKVQLARAEDALGVALQEFNDWGR